MRPVEPDHYGVLELEPGSPMAEVKSQYRRLAKRCHPDLHNNDVRSQEQFRRVNAAHAFLSDAPRKAAYDARLEAARKMKAPPLKASTPSSATGCHASVTATGYHARTPTDVRMTRSAWLGATAGAVLFLLMIGLFLDGSGPDRPVSVRGASHTTSESAFGSASGDGLGPDADGGPLADSLPMPFAVPAASPAPSSHLPPGVPTLPAPTPAGAMGRVDGAPRFRAGKVWTSPRAEEANPADALKQRLLARYHAVLPRTNRLINRGYAVHAASLDTENGSRRILRDQLAADLADLSATRTRVRPALARLSRQGTPKELQQEAGPILADLRRLEDPRQPVRNDLKALSPPAFRTSPAPFRFGLPAPARAAWVAPSPSLPADPAPTVSPVVPESPKPPDNPAVKLAAKPKAPASGGQEFILWGR